MRVISKHLLTLLIFSFLNLAYASEPSLNSEEILTVEGLVITLRSINIDGDDQPDVVYVTKENKIGFHLTNETSFETALPNIPGIQQIEVVDFDNDGKSEVLVLSDKGGADNLGKITIFELDLNDKSFTNNPHSFLESVHLPQQMQLADFNQDGRTDVLLMQKWAGNEVQERDEDQALLTILQQSTNGALRPVWREFCAEPRLPTAGLVKGKFPVPSDMHHVSLCNSISRDKPYFVSFRGVDFSTPQVFLFQPTDKDFEYYWNDGESFYDRKTDEFHHPYVEGLESVYGTIAAGDVNSDGVFDLVLGGIDWDGFLTIETALLQKNDTSISLPDATHFRSVTETHLEASPDNDDFDEMWEASRHKNRVVTKLIDLNQDGHLDIIAGIRATPSSVQMVGAKELAVLIGDGGGDFSEIESYELQGSLLGLTTSSTGSGSKKTIQDILVAVLNTNNDDENGVETKILRLKTLLNP